MATVKIYRVRVKEVWEQTYEVYATHPIDALTKVHAGEGTAVEGTFEYSHTLNNDDLHMVEEVSDDELTNEGDDNLSN